MEDQQVDKVVSGVRPEPPDRAPLTRTTTRPRPEPPDRAPVSSHAPPRALARSSSPSTAACRHRRACSSDGSRVATRSTLTLRTGLRTRPRHRPREGRRRRCAPARRPCPRLSGSCEKRRHDIVPPCGTLHSSLVTIPWCLAPRRTTRPAHARAPIGLVPVAVATGAPRAAHPPRPFCR